MSLSISDIIQIVGIFVSLISGLVAIIISIATLRQNSKMIEESTRPYIVFYSKVTNFHSPSYYFVLKNFGQTGAVITSFESDYDFKVSSLSDEYIPFKNIIGTYIAPSQAFITNVDPIRLFSEPRLINVTVKYETGKNKYSEIFVINLKADNDLVVTRSVANHGVDGDELKTLKIISCTLQNLAEQNL